MKHRASPSLAQPVVAMMIRRRNASGWPGSGRHGRTEEIHKHYNGVCLSDYLACAWPGAVGPRGSRTWSGTALGRRWVPRWSSRCSMPPRRTGLPAGTAGLKRHTSIMITIEFTSRMLQVQYSIRVRRQSLLRLHRRSRSEFQVACCAEKDLGLTCQYFQKVDLETVKIVR